MAAQNHFEGKRMSLTPYWNNLYDFFHMGGYALYVWGASGLAIAIFVLEPLFLKMKKKQILEKIKVFYSTPL